MKEIVVIHLNREDQDSSIHLLNSELLIHRRGCGGEIEKARALIQEYDGKVDALALENLPAELQLGTIHRPHESGSALKLAAQSTPLVDGSGIRDGLERWAVILADRAQPGIFSRKRANA